MLDFKILCESLVLTGKDGRQAADGFGRSPAGGRASFQQIPGALASEHSLSADRPSVERTGLLQGGIPVDWSSTLGVEAGVRPKHSALS